MNTIISPAVLYIQRKGGRDNVLNLNFYRNCHHYKLNRIKKFYKATMRQNIMELPELGIVKIHYKYHLQQNCDLGNVHSVVEKFLLDALVGYGKLKDDDCETVVASSYEFCGYDKEDPHVVVEISPCKKTVKY